MRAAGTNCDRETAHALELAGFDVRMLHVNRLLENCGLLHEHQLLAIPGGFSYGDDISAGRILANQIMHHLAEPLHRFVEAGKPILGVCNGFQVLVKTDLLPGSVGGKTGQTCTLTDNDCGRFMARWVHVAPKSQKCIWTAGVGPMELPIAHGEGKFVCANDAVRTALHDNDQIALVYTKPDGSSAAGIAPFNPNGSTDDIAGVCDESGLILGLMPHPERFVSQLQHPAWTSRKVDPSSEGPGLQLFRNAYRHVADAVGV
jgi:phosphoribosylformylglycinamidine synthase